MNDNQIYRIFSFRFGVWHFFPQINNRQTLRCIYFLLTQLSCHQLSLMYLIELIELLWIVEQNAASIYPVWTILHSTGFCCSFPPKFKVLSSICRPQLSSSIIFGNLFDFFLCGNSQICPKSCAGKQSCKGKCQQ